MGLDWCLKDKPKPGFEEEFTSRRDAFNSAGEAEDSVAYEQAKKAYAEVACNPNETLGVPRIGIDEAATRYFLDVIMPSHREGSSKRMAGDTYRKHWEQTDEVLLADAHGSYCVELVDEYKNISTLTAYGPFRDMAGAFSFRGKAVGYSELLNETLQNEAYQDMNPEDMADYAARIEEQAIGKAATKNPGLLLLCDGATGLLLATVTREWAEAVLEMRGERAKEAGYIKGMFGDWAKPETDGFREEDTLKYEHDEDLAAELLVILDGARWLRFWADLGHSMNAWY